MAAGDENRWISTSSTVYSTGANWSQGVKPVADENVVVGIEATADMLSGFDSNAAAVAVRSFHRHKDSTINIGTSTEPLVMATQIATNPINSLDPTGKVIVQGPGGFYYINGTGAGAQITDLMYVDTDTQDTTIEIDGRIETLNLLKGRIVALSNFDPADIQVGYRTNPATDVHLTLQGSPTITSISQQGGTVIHTGSGSPVTFVMGGGTFDNGRSAGSLSQIFQTGGTVIHRSATTTATAIIAGGTLDMSQDVRKKTITFLRVFPGATFKPNAHITIANGGSVFPLTNIEPASF